MSEFDQEPDEMPDDEDEQLLDRAWQTVGEWSPPKRSETPPPSTVVLNRGPRR